MSALRPLRALAAADLEVLGQWWQAIRDEPGRAPAGTELVQARLIRLVAAGELPEAGPVYLKWMHFPRRKDRLRYAFRRLPALHEASLLDVAARAGIDAAEPLAIGVHRSLGLPSRSLLVTRALPAMGAGVSVEQCVQIAAALAAAGVFHPDLNPGNFRPGSTGCGAAVLDFQSARALTAPLGRRLRLRMAAKLWFELAASTEGAEAALDADFDGAALRHGLLRPGELEPTRRVARILRARFERGRWLRCLRESTQFGVDRGWAHVTYRRREPGPDGNSNGWRPGGRALWLGDRWLELTRADYRPALTAWRRSRPVGWRGSEVLPTVAAAGTWTEVEPELRAAYDSARSHLSGRGP